MKELGHLSWTFAGASTVPSCGTERMMKKSRQKIDAALKAKIALEASRERSTVADFQLNPPRVRSTGANGTMRNFVRGWAVSTV